VRSALSIVVIAVVLAAGWWAAALRPDTRPPLAAALDVLPARTTVVGFTDWARVRAALGLGTVDTAAERDALTNESAARDLTSRSVVGRHVEQLHGALGWSPADLEWEVFGQDPKGAAAVVRLDRSVSFDDVRAGLDRAGYRADGELWTAPERTKLPSIMGRVALVPRQRLIVMSERSRQLPLVLDAIHGRARSLAANHDAAATAEALAGSDSVLLQGGRLGCGTSAVPDDADLQRQARAAIERAGGLAQYRFSGRGLVDHGGAGFSAQEVRFAMTFGSAATASEQARVRAGLAVGPFVGRVGQVEESLRLRSSASDDQTIRMAFAHDPDTAAFMTGTGPVLFATC
jgi:hypothetical protein